MKVLLCTALYQEAEPIIKQLGLKKDLACHCFQIFKNEKVILLITGTGKLKAAIGVTYLLTNYSCSKEDLLVNIGLAGVTDKTVPKGTIYMVNKLTDHDTGRTYYPDMIYKHQFNELQLETYSKVVTQLENELALAISKGNQKHTLIDMEATGVYEAAAVFLEVQQLIFVKVVSDHLNQTEISADEIKEYMSNAAKKIDAWLKQFNKADLRVKDIWTEEDEGLYKTIVEKLKLSVTMAYELKQIMHYAKCQGKNLLELLVPYKNMSCNSKKEGKQCFEELRRNIM